MPIKRPVAECLEKAPKSASGRRSCRMCSGRLTRDSYRADCSAMGMHE